MKSFEKGSVFGAVLIIVALIILIALGSLGYYAYKHPTVATNTAVGTTTTRGSVTVPTTTIIPVTVTTPGHTTVVSPFPGGTIYHNGVYGLTLALPVGYTYAETVSTFETFSDSDSIIFSFGGTRIFQVNVFSKPQWNAIRTQENLAHQNVNDLGEGNYYGENKNYIF